MLLGRGSPWPALVQAAPKNAKDCEIVASGIIIVLAIFARYSHFAILTMALEEQLRLIELEIDSAYRTNPLLGLNGPTALWNLLTYIEMASWSDAQGFDAGDYFPSYVVEEYLRPLAYPAYWLLIGCVPTGRLDTEYDEGRDAAARDLMILAREYRTFTAVFTYWSRRLAQLDISGREVVVTHNLADEAAYEAYNRLVPTRGVEGVDEAADRWKVLPFSTMFGRLTINRDRFFTKLKPKLIRAVVGASEPMLRAVFTLPKEWKFSRYSLQDYKAVWSSLSALAKLHLLARHMAARAGCDRAGRRDAVLVMSPDELFMRVARYSRVAISTVNEIVVDLTYGARGIERPQPFLQPLFRCGDAYMIMPTLVLSSSPERNLTALLNKLPDERRVYMQLTQDKEQHMRDQLETELVQRNYRTWHGFVPGRSDLPDVDLAIISDCEKLCILTQLKWFIDPAEVREVIERSKELEKGVLQARAIYSTFQAGHAALLTELQVDAEYQAFPLVISANWIGHGALQDPMVPIIEASHFREKVRRSATLAEVVAWLAQRDYLPTCGKHYEVMDSPATVAGWTVHWYAIGLLSKGRVRPV